MTILLTYSNSNIFLKTVYIHIYIILFRHHLCSLDNVWTNKLLLLFFNFLNDTEHYLICDKYFIIEPPPVASSCTKSRYCPFVDISLELIRELHTSVWFCYFFLQSVQTVKIQNQVTPSLYLHFLLFLWKRGNLYGSFYKL